MANREQRSNREAKKPKKNKKAPPSTGFSLSPHKGVIPPASPAPTSDPRKK
jgi:hypothetical protein